MIRFYLTRVGKGFYEGGEGGGSPPPPPPPAQTFTQDQVNALLAKERRAGDAAKKELVTQLETLRASEGTSKERATELEEQIASLQKQYMTKEELAAQDAKKQKAQIDTQLAGLTSERDHWKTAFTGTLVKSALQSAAAETEAYSADQMVTLLGGATKVVPVLKDGKATGSYEVKVDFTTVGQDGTPVTLELAPVDAMKKMKDEPTRFGNLFKSGVSGGLGSNNSGPAGEAADISKMDPATYRKNRANLIK